MSDSVTPWTAAPQASLSFTISQSLFKLMSIESVMPSNYLILCSPVLPLPSIFPSIRVLSLSQLFPSGGQSTRASALASVLPMNIQLNQFWELIFLTIRIGPLGCDYNCWSSLELSPPILEGEDQTKFTRVNPSSPGLSAQQFIFIIDNFQLVTW